MQTINLTKDITIHLLDTDCDYFFVIGKNTYFSSEYTYDLEKVKKYLADISDDAVEEITDHDIKKGICWEHICKVVEQKYPHMNGDYLYDRLACTIPLC